MLERRRITRTRIFAPALVIPSRLSLACECTVRDITSFGARLEFRNTAVLPYVFDLTFDSARTLRACHIVWRTPNEIGVRFSIPRKTSSRGSGLVRAWLTSHAPSLASVRNHVETAQHLLPRFEVRHDFLGLICHALQRIWPPLWITFRFTTRF